MAEDDPYAGKAWALGISRLTAKDYADVGSDEYEFLVTFYSLPISVLGLQRLLDIAAPGVNADLEKQELLKILRGKGVDFKNLTAKLLLLYG